jgi:hypothetical protein
MSFALDLPWISSCMPIHSGVKKVALDMVRLHDLPRKRGGKQSGKSSK